MSLQFNPSIITKDLVLYIDPANPKSLLQRQYGTPILNASTWTLGSGGVTGFNNNGLTIESERIFAPDPWGNQAVIWEARPSGNGTQDGGWNSTRFNVDITKTYMFSVWIYRPVQGTSGAYYFGTRGYGATDGVVRIPEGTINENPYFRSGGGDGTGDVTGDAWTLFVGFVYNYDTAETSVHPLGGAYQISTGASRLFSANTYKWHPDTTQSLHRAFLFGSTDSTVRQHLFDPRVYIVDGTEPSIEDLLYNRVCKVKSLIGEYEGTMINLPQFSSSNNGVLTFDGANDYIKTDYGEGIDLAAQELTIDVWVKANIITNMMFLAAGDDGQTTEDERFYVGIQSSTWALGIQDSIWTDSGVTATTDWTNVTLTCNPYTKTVKMYINGQYSGYSKTHTGFNLYGNFTLGNYDNAGNDWWWNGSIGAFKIYERVLSDDEINNNFLVMKGRYNV